MNIKSKPAEVTETVLAEQQAASAKAFDKTVDSLKQGAAVANTSMHQAQTQMKDGMDRAAKAAEHVMTFAQGNFEALVKSTQTLGAGWQEIGKRVAAHAQSSMDEAVSTMKALSGVKSIKEAVDIQTAYLRTAGEKAVSETSHITEQSVRIAEQAAAPIAARVTAAVETFARA